MPYSEDNGRIVGTMMVPKCMGCGPIIKGVWIESESNKDCPTGKEGSPYWGNVTLKFSGPYSSFTGKWNYRGGGQSRSWSGKLGKSRMALKPR